MTGLLFLINGGLAAGLYIVPLYTLMQRSRAEGSQGQRCGRQQFRERGGRRCSVLLFYALTFVLERLFGPTNPGRPQANPAALRAIWRS